MTPVPARSAATTRDSASLPARDGPYGTNPFTILTAQTETERILTARLEALGVTIERGTELTGLTQDDEGARLTVRLPDDSTAQIDACWVIGADGSHSTVRSLVGTRLEGSFKGERFLMGDVETQDELDRTSMHTFFSAAGPLIAFPMLGTRMRLIAQVHDPDGQPLNLSPTQDQLQQTVDGPQARRQARRKTGWLHRHNHGPG